MLKGVIFDLDGTLLDTLQDLSDSVNSALLKYGYPTHTTEEYKVRIGNGFRNLMEVSLPADCRDDTTVNNVLNEFLDVYSKNYTRKTKPYDGIEQMLSALTRKNVLLGVNSNKRTDYSVELVKQNFRNISFAGVIGERSGIPKKPDPTSALEIAARMKLKPAEIIYIGDSGTDIKTGNNAGMATAGVLWGFRGIEEFTQANADYVFHAPHEIAELLSFGG
jgi:haloacid dehalogenase superfamily, subfamily IA, variant 1 with third motif having Dx(3-4)D or Dx(3-4)E